MYKHIFTIGLISVSVTNFVLPVQAQKCIPLSLVGGKGNEVEKKVTIPSVFPFSRNNWNTDWSIPNTQKFRSYKAIIVSDEGGIFDVKMYLKYSDETADPFYEQNDLELLPQEPLDIKINGRRKEQPYQVNLLMGGIEAAGNQYRASVFGCK